MTTTNKNKKKNSLQAAQNELSVNAAEFAPRRETRQASRDALIRIATFANDENN